MPTNDNVTIDAMIKNIRHLSSDSQGSTEFFQAAALAQVVLHDTVGGNHPLMATLESALQAADWQRAAAASRAVVLLYNQGGLTSPRLAIAHEIEGDILEIAQSQLQAAETLKDSAQKQLQLAVAAFLTGASLEDALRRLCDASSIPYDAQRSNIAKLQAALFQPSKQIEVISSSENKQITAWGDTRNKADHGKFEEITYSEVMSIVIGVRTFIDRHLHRPGLHLPIGFHWLAPLCSGIIADIAFFPHWGTD